MVRSALNKAKTLLLITFLSLNFVALSGCSEANGDESADVEEEKKEIPIPVLVNAVSSGDLLATYNATTTLEAEGEAQVVAKVGGIVTKILVEEGDQVDAGQPIAQLETDKLRLEVARSAANMRKLKQELDRNRRVYEKKLISSDAFEKIRFEYESQAAGHKLTELNLKYATVRAPIGGVVSKRHIKVGNMVNQNQEVYQITDFDPLRALIYVPERELHKLNLGQTAALRVDAYPNEAFEAEVKLISPIIDATSGTFKVTLEVTDNDGRLRPGMFGQVQVIWDVREQVLKVPASAITVEANESSVFVVKDGVAKKVKVATGLRQDSDVEVTSGLSSGDWVVTTGQSSLRSDAPVEVLNADELDIADGSIRDPFGEVEPFDDASDVTDTAALETAPDGDAPESGAQSDEPAESTIDDATDEQDIATVTAQ